MYIYLLTTNENKSEQERERASAREREKERHSERTREKELRKRLLCTVLGRLCKMLLLLFCRSYYCCDYGCCCCCCCCCCSCCCCYFCWDECERCGFATMLQLNWQNLLKSSILLLLFTPHPFIYQLDTSCIIQRGNDRGCQRSRRRRCLAAKHTLTHVLTHTR